MNFQFVPQREHNVLPIEAQSVNLFAEIIAVYCRNVARHMNTLCGQNVDLLLPNFAVFVQTIRPSTVDLPTRRFFIMVDSVGKLSRKACVDSVF
jgi:hypothetical protein